MDGEVQPKGLMVSLILMNLTAIVIFFFATPAREMPKKVSDNVNTEVMYEDEQVLVVMKPGDAEKVKKCVVLHKKISEDPWHNLGEYQTKIPGCGRGEYQTLPEKRVINTKNNTKEASDRRQLEPPLAVALKKFIGGTGSGVRIFFEGLKNGYTKKKIRESIASKISMRSVTTDIVSNLDQSPQTIVNPDAKLEINESHHVSSPTQHEPPPSWIWEDGSISNQETIPTDIIMDVLSSTQKRTNELISVFSKKVVPAIERMNDKVADAIRLEKNLDSYTSALISAINSVVCPNMNVQLQNSKPRTSSGVRKVKQTKCSNLTPDAQFREVGSFSAGEQSSNKRPVFKTLAARCWHTKNRRISYRPCRNSSRIAKQLAIPGYSDDQQSNECHLYEKCETNLENDDLDDVANDQCIIHTESPHQKTIGIEDVLTLTSSLEQSSDQRMVSDRGMQPFLSPPSDVSMSSGTASRSCVMPPPELENIVKQSSDQGFVCDGDMQPFLSPLSSDVSMSSGMISRSCVMPPPELENILKQSSDRGMVSGRHMQPFLSPLSMISDVSMSSGMISRTCVMPPAEHKSENGAFKSDQAVTADSSDSAESAGLPRSVLREDSTLHGRQHMETLSSDLSVVCDSRLQGYDSLVLKESSAVAHSSQKPKRSAGSFTTDSKVITQPQGESNLSVSFSGMANTLELVNTFQQLNPQQKEIAVENVCLLVLRIFEAWTESQRSLSSSGLSRISLSTLTSKDELSSRTSPPCTAICSPIDSVDRIERMNKSLPMKITEPTPKEIATDSDQTSTEISRNLLQNVVEAVEIQLAERSLMGVKTNIRNPLLRGDVLKSCVDPADTYQSGFGDIKETIDEEITVPLIAKSRDSLKVSKESSAATFYTDQPESSEDAFYECVSTMSGGTCLELEVENSSNVFLERIQEEGCRKNDNIAGVNSVLVAGPQSVQSSFSIESWLTDSEELRTAKHAISEDNSSFDVACSTDDEPYPCSSMELSETESKPEDKKSKKKKWGTKFIKKFLKKKAKPSSLLNVALPKNRHKSQSDFVLKPTDQNESTQ